MRIKITAGKLEMFATLNESKTAKLIWDNLPITSKAERWGDEVYFYIKPKTGIEKRNMVKRSFNTIIAFFRGTATIIYP